MSTDSKILLIVNPISGKRKNKKITILQNLIDKSLLNIEMKITSFAGEGEKIATAALNSGTRHFVVVGGDGTVNEVARAIYKTEGTSLGIIPTGSGNGLARHLKLPINTEEAFRIATGTKTFDIDVGLLNDRPFFSVAGIGFDAKVAQVFSQMKGRGIKNYVIAVIKNYPGYKGEKYIISFNDKTITQKLFFISLANSNQFGGNISISPKASLQDGLIDICMMTKIPTVKAAFLFPVLFMKRLHKTKYLNIFQTTQATIQRENGGYIHIDGDPYMIHDKILTLSIKEKALSIHVE